MSCRREKMNIDEIEEYFEELEDQNQNINKTNNIFTKIKEKIIKFLRGWENEK